MPDLIRGSEDEANAKVTLYVGTLSIIVSAGSIFITDVGKKVSEP